ncbi:MAG: histidine kinase [Phycisphaerae bacterium]|nr:histidine kinase [Saprospiraceae bacterium]
MRGLRTTSLTSALCFILISAIELSAQHPSWQNYTMREGLLSNEIYDMMQDSRGLMWFSTSQGICHFNGYEFIRPVDTSVAVTGSTFQIVEDTQGRIWYMNFDATLSIIEKDTVRPWPYNHFLKSFDKNNSNYHFTVGNDSTVWIPSWKSGFLIVKPNGDQQVVPALNRNVNIFAEIDGRVMTASASSENAAAEYAFDHRTGQTSEMIHWQHGKALSIGLFPVDYQVDARKPSFRFWRLKNGDFIGLFLQTFYLIRDNRLIWHSQKDNGAETIFEDNDGSILMAVSRGKNQGLLRFRSLEHFQRDEFDNLLPGKTVVQALRDREGGWWATTADAGIFYCKYPGLALFGTADGLPATEVKTLASDAKGRIYAGLRQLNIVVFQPTEGRPTLLPPAPIMEMQVLRFDTLTGRLWVGNNLCFWEKNRWTFAKWLYSSGFSGKHISVNKITPAYSGDRWWASSHVGVFLIDPVVGTGYVHRLDPFETKRTFSVTPDSEGNLWVTDLDGLRLVDQDGHYVLPPFNHLALRFKAIDMELLPEAAAGGMVIALVGGGLLIRDQTGRFTHLTTKDGLSTDFLTELDVSPEGVIYACSNAGLNILSRQTDRQWHVETISTKHGLPSNQINDVAFLGTEIWIATDGGLVRFHGKPTPAPMPAPILEKFVVNNNSTVFSENLQLPYDQNNLAIRFYSLHYRSGGDIPYRYRLIGADTVFVYTHTREVNFANLSSGRYTFEVQAQNEDGQWSESAKWVFQILTPWWASWWFWAFVAAAFATAAYLFYRKRLDSIRHNAKEREKIRDLETAALRAQMNPHFIFNCLQAIQSFIAHNDRDAAATYLARFAKLVRLALHGSVDGRHSLAEEIAMLDNYLHLEQMRFKGKFEFSIRAEGLDLDEISLPPMLVQPFVENALIHGLQNLESEGNLEIIFTLKDNVLEVLVRDNGPGFSEKGSLEKGSHKSVGMMLTQKRLDMLMGSGKALTRKTVLDAQGVSIGAQVQIFIPI